MYLSIDTGVPSQVCTGTGIGDGSGLVMTTIKQPLRRAFMEAAKKQTVVTIY